MLTTHTNLATVPDFKSAIDGKLKYQVFGLFSLEISIKPLSLKGYRKKNESITRSRTLSPIHAPVLTLGPSADSNKGAGV